MLFFGEKECVFDETEVFADETSVEIRTDVLAWFLVTSFYNSAAFQIRKALQRDTVKYSSPTLLIR